VSHEPKFELEEGWLVRHEPRRRWETQIDPTLVFGIPMIATIGKEGRPTENLQINADFDVLLPYDAFINGKDTQIEKAVEEMLKAIKN
jgi:tricorn protease